MTKREYFEGIKEFVKDNETYVTFLDAEIERIDKRAAKGKETRAAKTAFAGDAIREAVLKALEDAGRPITLPELAAAVEIEGVTPNKIVYHIRPCVERGEIIKEKAKVGDRKVMTYALGEQYQGGWGGATEHRPLKIVKIFVII